MSEQKQDEGMSEREVLIRGGFAFDSDRDCTAARDLLVIIDRLRAANAALEERVRAAEETAKRAEWDADTIRADYAGSVAVHDKKIAGLTKERDEALRHARNLLAVIHRDGGHYTAEHGYEKSCKDAEAIVLADRRERDEARIERDRLHKVIEHNHADAMIGHRWFEKHFGEQMNGRDFAIKCQMVQVKALEYPNNYCETCGDSEKMHECGGACAVDECRCQRFARKTSSRYYAVALAPLEDEAPEANAKCDADSIAYCFCVCHSRFSGRPACIHCKPELFKGESAKAPEANAKGVSAEAGKCEGCGHATHEGKPCDVLIVYDRPLSPPGNRRCFCGFQAAADAASQNAQATEPQLTRRQTQILRACLKDEIVESGGRAAVGNLSISSRTIIALLNCCAIREDAFGYYQITATGREILKGRP